MRVALITLGCRVNQAESSLIEGSLKHSGATIVDLNDNPDVCIVNTCTVTANSDRSSRQLIRKAARTGARVIVTGCYSQLRPHELGAIPGVSKVIENTKKYDIVKMLAGKQSEIAFNSHSRSRPHLKVQDGCNFSCSYCAVPQARGRSRSVPLQDVLQRAQAIEAAGYREIVLTGIHLGTYGHDLPTRSDLNELLKELLLTTEAVRFRLSSLEVGEVNDELIEIMQSNRICNHLHLPLQSGSNRVLQLMRRSYTFDQYRNKVLMLFDRVENISLGTDVLVGFPGEGDSDFEDTLTLLKDLPLSYLHIFPFSSRPGTEAQKMPGTLKKEVRSGRLRQLHDLDTAKRESYARLQLNKMLSVIIEESHGENLVCGTAANYLKILVRQDSYNKGSLVSVRPTDYVRGMLQAIAIS